ncbi:hypothetical protein BHM03_00049505 [Ensete ventricosum]|nr:hypothetical protein BHM03_00049505 [Ensete ventricosum]
MGTAPVGRPPASKSCRLQGRSLAGTPAGAVPMEVPPAKGSSSRPLARRLSTGKGSHRPLKGDGARGARGFEVTLPELLNMLREVESAIKKEKPVLYISETKKKRKANKIVKKRKSKGRPGKAMVLARPRRLARGEMDLKMGNGAIVATVTVGEVIRDLGIISSSMKLIPIYNDSDRAIALARELMSHQNFSKEVSSY